MPIMQGKDTHMNEYVLCAWYYCEDLSVNERVDVRLVT